MKYMLLIYTPETGGPELGSPEHEAEMAGYFAFTNELVESGKFIAGDPLQGIDTATTVTLRDGKTLTTDGPFAETNEVLGGYYLVEATDLDDALGLAAKIPAATWGKIEVRPLAELPSM